MKKRSPPEAGSSVALSDLLLEARTADPDVAFITIDPTPTVAALGEAARVPFTPTPEAEVALLIGVHTRLPIAGRAERDRPHSATLLEAETINVHDVCHVRMRRCFSLRFVATEQALHAVVDSQRI